MNILAIDDDTGMRASYDLLLDGLGHHLVFAADAPEAEASLRNTTFDVVLLDQNLQGSSGGPMGLELVETIRTWSPAAIIVVVSGYPDEP